MEIAEENLIGEDLEKLFALQDKHLSKDKRAILVKALVESNLPTGAILLGIRKLMGEDLSSIKMGTIFAAARSYVQQKVASSCPSCSDGFIAMRDEDGIWFALSCFCLAGKPGLTKWRGQNTQLVNGKLLKKVEIELAPK